MTLTDFAKRMKTIGSPATPKTRRRHKAKPIEIIDDVVDIGAAGAGWDKMERNGRVYLTRK